MLSIIIPAYNESAVVEKCLDSIIAQAKNDSLANMEVIVAANGCEDDTASQCRSKTHLFERLGIGFFVLELDHASKSRAIRSAETVANFANRSYLDADVILGPDTLRQIMDTLTSTTYPMIVCRLAVTKNASWIGRAYAAAMLETPYFKSAKTGAGFQTVSAAGRARWGEMPDIISDDVFIRSHFADDEISLCDATYAWPVATSWKSLSLIRRRQSRGLMELQRLRPAAARLRQSKAEALWWLIRLCFRQPLAALVYVAVLSRAHFQLRSRPREWHHDRSNF